MDVICGAICGGLGSLSTSTKANKSIESLRSWLESDFPPWWLSHQLHLALIRRANGGCHSRIKASIMIFTLIVDRVGGIFLESKREY